MSIVKQPKRITDQLARMATAFGQIDALLTRLGIQGLQRMSRSSIDELGALKLIAHNAGLIEIERALESLVTYVTRSLERDPLFELNDYAQAINRIWLLNNAARRLHSQGKLPAEMLETIGRARRSFMILDTTLEVQALAAHGWVTDSGFVGVTVYLHAHNRPEILQVSVARPTAHFGTDPTRMFGFGLNDALEISARDLAHGAWDLGQAKISSDRRLSMHADLKVDTGAYRGGTVYDAYKATTWHDLLNRVRERDQSPVSRSDGVLVYLEPQAFKALTTDEVRGVVHTVLKDSQGAELVLQVTLRGENNTLIDNLESIAGGKSPQPNGYFGRAWVTDGQLCFHPYTAVYDEAIAVRRHTPKVHGVHLSVEIPKQSRGDGVRRRRR